MREKKTNQIDMIHGSLVWKLMLFAMPLAASSILQQLFNSADVAVVGRFAGSKALAAVGSNSSVIALFVNAFVGLSIGANVVIANYIGQRKKECVQDIVHTVMAFAFLLGVVLMVLGIFIARPVLEAIGTPDDVLGLAVQYLRLYYLGVPFIIVFNFGAAILRSMGDTKRPMYCLILAGVINVILNLVFVMGFHLGVAGVALATDLSNIVSSVIVVILLMHEEEMIRFHWSRLYIHGFYLKKMIQIGAPAALQSAIFSLSNVFIQSGINGFGQDAIAGSSTGLNFEYFTYFMCSAFAQAVVTFTSQNYGAGEWERCKRTFRIGMVEGVLCTAALSVLFTLGGEFLVSLYTTDSAVAEYALNRMHHVMALECLTCLYEITGSSLRGLGYSLLPALLTVFGSVGFRIVWLYTVFAKWHSFSMLMSVYPVSWILTMSMMLFSYVVVIRRIERRNQRVKNK